MWVLKPPLPPAFLLAVPADLGWAPGAVRSVGSWDREQRVPIPQDIKGNALKSSDGEHHAKGEGAKGIKTALVQKFSLKGMDQINTEIN